MLDWKRRPRSRLRTAAQLREISVRSLPPRDYQLLPMLESPAGYICVLRDIARDVYRIDSADHPATYIDALLGELTGSYGIEVIAILETDNIGASERQLFDAHHARLSDEWLELDAYQLRALRKSELRILEYSSHYMSKRQTSPASATRRSGSMARLAERGAAGQSPWEDAAAPSPPGLEFYRYGGRQRQQEAHEPDSWRQSLSDKFDDFLHNHPGLVIASVLLVMLLLLIHIWRNPYIY